MHAPDKLGRFLTRAGAIVMLDREQPGGLRQGFVEGAAGCRHVWYRSGQSRTRPELDIVCRAEDVERFGARPFDEQAHAIAERYGDDRFKGELAEAVVAYGQRCASTALKRVPRPAARLQLAGRID